MKGKVGEFVARFINIKFIKKHNRIFMVLSIMQHIE